MIKSRATKAAIKRQWEAITRLKEWHRRVYAIPGGGMFIDPSPKELSNLQLVLAFCALEEFLYRCFREGLIKPKKTRRRRIA